MAWLPITDESSLAGTGRRSIPAPPCCTGWLTTRIGFVVGGDGCDTVVVDVIVADGVGRCVVDGAVGWTDVAAGCNLLASVMVCRFSLDIFRACLQTITWFT